MKRIIRLTEGDLHGMVRDAVRKILRETNGGQVIGAIVNAIRGQWAPDSLAIGENEIDVELGDDASVYISFNLVCNPYIRPGMRSGNYDVPDDPDEIIDEPEVEINQILMYLDNGNKQSIIDDGRIQSEIEEVVGNTEIEYDWDNVPSQGDYFYHED